MTTLKFCTKCLETKEGRYFGLNKKTKDGLYYWCKVCVSLHNAERKNKPKIKVDELNCSTCLQTKPVSNFDKASSSKTGYRLQCKSCRHDRHQVFKDAINQRMRERRANDPEIAAKEESWRQKNMHSVLANRVRYRSENRGRRAAWQNKRRAAKIQATPKWADEEYIEDLYVNCREAESIFEAAGIDVKFQVDHIVPLQGRNVCGLHVENNMQILTADENAKKHNSFQGEQLLTSLGG